MIEHNEESRGGFRPLFDGDDDASNLDLFFSSLTRPPLSFRKKLSPPSTARRRLSTRPPPATISASSLPSSA